MENDNDLGEEIAVGSGNTSNSSTAKSFNCSICNASFSMRRMYERHLQMHANGLSNNDSNNFFSWGESNMIGIPGSNTGGSSVVFPEPEEVNSSDYPGTSCDRVLKGLKANVSRQHTEEDNSGGNEDNIQLNGSANSSIVCDLCGSFFNNRDNLINHLVEVHGTTIVKPEPVGLNNASKKDGFSNGNGVVENGTNHRTSGIDLDEAVPFCEHQCYVCHREFVSARALSVHQAEAHGIEDSDQNKDLEEDNGMMIPLPNLSRDYDVECEDEMDEMNQNKRNDKSLQQNAQQIVKLESFPVQPPLPTLTPGDKAGIVISNVFSLNEVPEPSANPITMTNAMTNVMTNAMANVMSNAMTNAMANAMSNSLPTMVSSNNSLLQRRRSRTSDAADYVHMCRFCGKAYAHPSNKFRHQRVCSLRHSNSQESGDESADASDPSITISVNTTNSGHDCHVCGSRFTNAVGLAVHVRKMHGGEQDEDIEDDADNRQLFCCDCGVKFALMSNLGSHRKKNCPYRDDPAETAGVWRCYTCGSPFPSVIGYLQHGMDNPTHCRVHHQQQKDQGQLHETADKPWPCTLCRKFFATKPDLNHHRQVTHGLGSYVLNAPGNWHCPVCDRQFRYKHHMIRHQRSAHEQGGGGEDDIMSDGSPIPPAPEIEVLATPTVPTIPSPSSNIKGLSCEDCGIAFSTRRLLIRHMERVHRVLENQVTQQLSDEHQSGMDDVHGDTGDMEVSPVWIGGKEAFMCNRPGCSRVFSSKNGLSVHMYRAHVRHTLEQAAAAVPDDTEKQLPGNSSAQAAPAQVKILPRPANLTKAQVSSSWESAAVFPGPQPMQYAENIVKEKRQLEEDEVDEDELEELEDDEDMDEWEDDGGLPTMAGMIYSNAGKRRNLPRCHLCGKKFRSRMGLKVHHSIMHNSASKRFGDLGHSVDREMVSFACNLCGREFTTAPGLKRHNTRSHGGIPGPRRGSRNKNRQLMPAIHIPEHKEELKDMNLDNKGSIMLNGEKDELDREIEDEKMDGEENGDEKTERYRCTLCHRNFPSAMGLRVHKSRNHGIPSSIDDEELDDLDDLDDLGGDDDHLSRLHSVPIRTAPRYSAPTMVSMTSLRPLSLTETSNDPGEDDWTCTICNRSFRNRMGLSTHQRTHGSKAPSRIFGCERCLQRFTKWCNMVTHQKTCCPVKLGLFCPYCDERFDQGLEMYSHIAGVHAESESDVPCPKCPERFSSPTKLREHLSMTHVPCEDEEEGDEQNRSDDLDKEEIELPPKPQRVGKVTFSSPPRRPPAPATVIPPDAESTTIEVASAGPHARKPPCFDIVQTANIINFACKHCDRIYPSQKAVEGHQSAHKSKRRVASPDYEPDLPPKRPRALKPRPRFSDDMDMPRPDGEGPFPCQHCDKTFRSIQAVYAHQRAHSPTRRHLCSDCGRGFVSRTSLAYHQSWYCTGVRSKRRKRVRKKPKKIEEMEVMEDEVEPVQAPEDEEEEGNSIEEQDDEEEDIEGEEAGEVQAGDGSQSDFLFGCNICGKMFRFENRMLNHKQTAHPNFVKPVKKSEKVVVPITEILNESALDDDVKETKNDEAVGEEEDQCEETAAEIQMELTD